MIKANVITKNASWYKYIKNPNSYIDRKINKLNNKNKKLKKKSIYFTLLLSSKSEIKNLNRKFRKKNRKIIVESIYFTTLNVFQFGHNLHNSTLFIESKIYPKTTRLMLKLRQRTFFCLILFI